MKNFTRDPSCLGYIVLYGTSSEIHHTVNKVDHELRSYNLDIYQLTRPTAIRAVSRAAKKIEKSSEHKFSWNVVNNLRKKSVAIIHEEVNKSNDTIKFQQKTTGVYNKVTKSFQAKGPDAEKFETFFDHYSKYVTGDDIRQMARNIIEEAHCISLRGGTYVRDAGGVYFVPRDRINEMESLKHVLENLKIGYVKAFSVTNGKSEREDLFNTAIIYFKKEMESIQNGADKVTSRVSSLEKYKKQLEGTKAKMIAYALLTGRRKNKQVDEFYSQLHNCMVKIEKKIKRLKSKKKKKLRTKSE